MPGNFALSTSAPIAISPDSWSNDFTASSDAGAQENVSYETKADSIETAQIGTDARAESLGAGVTDGGARAVSAVNSAGTAASIVSNAAAQSAPAPPPNWPKFALPKNKPIRAKKRSRLKSPSPR